MRENIAIEEKYLYEYIMNLFDVLKRDYAVCQSNVYHHNTSYKSMVSILNHGIHPLITQNQLGIMDISQQQLNVFSDVTSHVNGEDGISLSKTNLDDLYPDENEYNPYKDDMVDIIIDDVQAQRITTHYGNEFIHNGSILQDKFLFIDTRILSMLNRAKDKDDLLMLKDIVEKVNYLKEFAITMKKMQLNIPIREMSHVDNHENGVCLDLNRLSVMSKIIVKK